MTAKISLLVAVIVGLSAFAPIESASTSQIAALQQVLLRLAPKDAEDKALEEAAMADTDDKEVVTSSLRKAKPVASHEAAPAELDDSITQLVLEKAVAAFGATPFGSSVKKIIGIIQDDMIPKVKDAHKGDQTELNKLAQSLSQCGSSKDDMKVIADKSKTAYLKFSPLHQTCRSGEAGLSSSKSECFEELGDRKKIKELKCKAFAMVDAKLGSQHSNTQIVKKGGSEGTEAYLDRISQTMCGNDDDPSRGGGAKCGSPQCGFKCQFHCAKNDCDASTKDFNAWTRKCNKIRTQYNKKVVECDNLQDQMDGAACKRAVDMKDACETYAECYTSTKESYKMAKDVVVKDEVDRQAEWKGLKRMQCLMEAFTDGKVKTAEVKACQKKTHTVDHLVIKYPKLDDMAVCSVPKLYPSTGEYKKAEFAPLPTLAKGKQNANECAGVTEISTTPASGSPASCKCERITLNGPYSGGPMVKCSNCNDVRRTTDAISCPSGTKLFAPRSREDWKTFLASAQPLRDPHWIIDITRPQNGCGGCTGSSMNSNSNAQHSWVTQDGSPWWLRSTKYGEPNGDYHANCYLNVKTPSSENDIGFNDGSCHYHSKSYYCQLESVPTTPKKGSPQGCTCEKVELTGRYSAGVLIKCTGCLDVHRSTQKNSCPEGTKIFSPRTREDWKTFIDSAQPLRSPHWIIDVTRPANGCGGCTGHAMNSNNGQQKTWRTADGSPWWLRSTSYGEPNGDYQANCYLDLWQTPSNEHSVTFNDGTCGYHSNSYYCQPARTR